MVIWKWNFLKFSCLNGVLWDDVKEIPMATVMLTVPDMDMPPHPFLQYEVMNPNQTASLLKWCSEWLKLMVTWSTRCVLDEFISIATCSGRVGEGRKCFVSILIRRFGWTEWCVCVCGRSAQCVSDARSRMGHALCICSRSSITIDNKRYYFIQKLDEG